ncbi:MAG TPA: beta-ketoacyl-[acyl-carrier-protein] synthase family protein [Bryobacteraceae bacterium]|nr:beta-ketoacyl-[acyl-carrier-protein] synthase family protein [Bryobacteraceae bacterium]
MSDRVVVTGAGVIASIGAGVEEFERNLFAGCSGVGPSPLMGGNAVAAEVRNFNPQPWLGNKGIRVLDRSARLLSVAAHMALGSTGLSQQEGDGDPDLGLVCGTMFGSVHSITSFDWSGITEGPNYVNPMEFPNTVINSPSGQAAIKHKLRGVNSTISAGLVSGLYAIHYAAEFLRFGRATALMAGGVEELCEESFLSFAKVGVISQRGCPQPFGPDRDGTVLGEGSALWMMETAAGAEARGAKAQLEVCGFGATQDAHDVTAFRVRGEGATSAIRQALRSAGIEPDAIGGIIAGASGSRAGDEMEVHALRNVFGDRLGRIPVCAPKSAYGEAMGASGALGALTAGLALAKGFVPPTAGYHANNAGLMLSSQPQALNKEYALVNCFGCDGNNAALVLKGLN